jgi:hypothetical protein
MPNVVLKFRPSGSRRQEPSAALTEALRRLGEDEEMQHRLPPPLLGLALQGQPLFPVQPVDQVFPYLPAFPPQQNQDLAISVPDPALSDLPDPGTQLGPLPLVALVAVGAAADTQNSAGMPFAGPVLVL